MRLQRAPGAFLWLCVALLLAPVLGVAGFGLFMRMPRPLPPDREQDEIYSAVLAKPWPNQTREAGLEDRPDAAGTFTDADLRHAPTEPRPPGNWLVARLEPALQWLRPPNGLGYTHPFPATVGARLSRGTKPTGAFLLSRIAFNVHRDRAVVWGQFSWTSPYPFSEGYAFYLARDTSGHWTVTESAMLWIT